MRTSERLRKMQQWTYETVCKGRQMKAPAANMDVSVVKKEEPRVYVAYYPARQDISAYAAESALHTAPSILLLPTQSYARNMEEQRFDRYNKVSRPKDLGQQLRLQVLFSVFEDGVRMPGFVKSAKEGEMNLALLREGTDEGFGLLMNWMDDFMEALLGVRIIPGTDLHLNECDMTYSLLEDQQYLSDRRPLYYGFVNVTFDCYAERRVNEDVNDLLL